MGEYLRKKGVFLCENYFRKKFPEKKEGRVLERTRQSMKRKISNDL